jgi:hypothetical protein
MKRIVGPRSAVDGEKTAIERSFGTVFVSFVDIPRRIWIV